MTTNKAAEALLRWARALDDRLSKDFGIPKSAEFILDESLDRIIAEATAQQAAEVARLREALAEAMGWLERSDREQNVHQFRHGMSMLRAALAVDPAVAPAPNSGVGDRGHRYDADGHCIESGCRFHVVAQLQPAPGERTAIIRQQQASGGGLVTVMVSRSDEAPGDEPDPTTLLEARAVTTYRHATVVIDGRLECWPDGQQGRVHCTAPTPDPASPCGQRDHPKGLPCGAVASDGWHDRKTWEQEPGLWHSYIATRCATCGHAIEPVKENHA